MEQFDESVIWHVASCIYESFSLLFYVVLLVVLEVFVEGLSLHWWPFSLWVEVVKVWEAHCSEIGFIVAISYLTFHIFFIWVIWEVLERNLFHITESSFLLFCVNVLVVITVIIYIVERLRVLNKFWSEEFLNSLNSSYFNTSRWVFLLLHFLSFFLWKEASSFLFYFQVLVVFIFWEFVFVVWVYVFLLLVYILYLDVFVLSCWLLKFLFVFLDVHASIECVLFFVW